MQNSMQMNAIHFAWKVSGRFEVPASQKDFSCCHPQVPELSCCAELHGKVYILYKVVDCLCGFLLFEVSQFGGFLAV